MEKLRIVTTFSILRRTFFQARSYWLNILGIFICNFLGSPISLLKPLALKILIDNGFSSKPMPGYISFFFPTGFQFSFMAVVWIAISLVLLIALLENIYSVIIWILNTRVGEKLVRTLRSLLFNHIQRLSLAYHDRTGTADAVYRIQNDASSIRTLLIGNVQPILTSFITLTAMIVIMFTINWRFAIITCFMIPPFVFFTRISSRKLKSDWRKLKQSESNAMAVIQEVLASLRLVKAFGQEDGESERYMSKADIAMKGQLKVAWVGALYYFCVGMTFAIGTAMFIFFGARYVHEGEMTLGELTMVITYLSQIYGPIDKLTRSFNEIQSSTTSLERVYNLLDEEKEVIEAEHPIHLNRCKGSIEFRQVFFNYGNGIPILHDISFTINPGDRVGIMGSTGSGKSTLINLITRFYDTTSGKIILDSIDIKNYKLSDYRKQFSIVLQEPVLFSTSIGENIRYGRPGSSEKEMIDAAKAANAHDFIIKCKDGYDTLVGERGMQLSGGERQRISLARAFIKNAPVLIMDEPTSSLDIKTEAAIMEAIERLMKGRTTFMITHRLDTLKSCNLILHLDNGKLIDEVRDHDIEFIEKKKTAFLKQAK